MSDLQAFCNFGPFPHPEAYEVRIITERGWFHTASSLACMNSIRKVKNKSEPQCRKLFLTFRITLVILSKAIFTETMTLLCDIFPDIYLKVIWKTRQDEKHTNACVLQTDTAHSTYVSAFKFNPTLTFSQVCQVNTLTTKTYITNQYFIFIFQQKQSSLFKKLYL